MERDIRLALFTPAFLTDVHGEESGLCGECIRHALRTWFRIVGGSHGAETELFDSDILEFRVTERDFITEERAREAGGIAARYRPYFQSIGGDFKGQVARDGILVLPESTFLLQIRTANGKTGPASYALEQALAAFCLLGTVGMRGQRGCGALYRRHNLPTFREFLETTRPWDDLRLNWLTEDSGEPTLCADFSEALLRLGRYLRRRLQEGNEEPVRSLERLRLRPVPLREGVLAVHYLLDVNRTLALDVLPESR